MHITSETVEQCNANQLRKVTYKNTASNDWNTDRAGQYQLDAVSARFLQDHEVTDRDRLVIALRELAKDGYDVERRPVAQSGSHPPYYTCQLSRIVSRVEPR